VHYLDNDKRNLHLENLATTCIFCHQCFNIDQVVKMRSGVLVWLPEIDQADLHHIARAIYIGRISQGAMAEAARKSLDTITARRAEARQRIGTDDPYVLSAVLRDFLTQRHYADRDAKLKGIRLFPLDRRIIKEADLEFNQFPQILAYWRSKDGPYGKHAPVTWGQSYKSALAGLNSASSAADDEVKPIF
jgi:intracellular multiplication protein IcmJ